MKTYLMIGSALGLFSMAACTSTDEPVRIGRDSYVITSSAGNAFTTSADIQHTNLVAASKFCASQGKEIDALSSNESNALGQKANGSVSFRCLSANDPEYARKSNVQTLKIESGSK